jgi:hypothetical protein
MVHTTPFFCTFTLVFSEWCTRWRSWLRHCATIRKVADSIPDGVTGNFQWFNPSGRIVALGSTQPLTEMSTTDPSWGKDGRCVGLTTLPPSCADCLEILGVPTSWNPKGLSRPVAGKLYLYCNWFCWPLVVFVCVLCNCVLFMLC